MTDSDRYNLLPLLTECMRKAGGTLECLHLLHITECRALSHCAVDCSLTLCSLFVTCTVCVFCSHVHTAELNCDNFGDLSVMLILIFTELQPTVYCRSVKFIKNSPGFDNANAKNHDYRFNDGIVTLLMYRKGKKDLTT